MPTVDVGLDPTTGDLPAVTRWISGAELTAQRAGIRLRTYYGEYILDQYQGLDFPGWREQRPPDLTLQRGRILSEIASTPGVVRVVEIESTHDTDTQTVRHTGTVIVEADEGSGSEVALTYVVATGRNTTPVVTAFYPIGAVPTFFGGL